MAGLMPHGRVDVGLACGAALALLLAAAAAIVALERDFIAAEEAWQCALTLLCAMHPPRVCVKALDAWRALALAEPAPGTRPP